jgi:hypothetical protein
MTTSSPNARLRTLRRVAPTTFAFLFLACFLGPRAPEVKTTRELGLGEEGTDGFHSKKAFGIIHMSPTTDDENASEVSVVFNRPIAPLELATNDVPSFATIAADGKAVKGEWRYLGTNAIAFVPDGGFARATRYQVTLASGIKALDGSVLAEGKKFAFSTAAPRLVSVDPTKGGSNDLDPTTAFKIRFDQPMTKAAIEAHLRLEGTTRGAKDAAKPSKAQKNILSGLVETGRKAFAFSVRPVTTGADGKELSAAEKTARKDLSWELVPNGPLPLNTDLEFATDGKLVGQLGPIPVAESNHTFGTFGPLEVQEVRCWERYDSGAKGAPACEPGRSGSVSFTNEIAYSDLVGKVVVEGAPLRWEKKGENGYTFYLPAEYRPGTRVSVTVKAGLKDVHGQTLAKDVTKTFTVADLRPSFQVGLQGRVLEAKRAAATREIPMGAVNFGETSVDIASVTEGDIVDAVLQPENAPKGVTTQKLDVNGGKNRFVVRKLALDPILAKEAGFGTVWFRANAGGDRPRLVTVTDLAISVKASRFGTMVWVTRLSDGKPVPNASVTVRGEKGTVFTTATTDKDGFVTIGSAAFNPVDGDGNLKNNAVFVAREGKDWSWQRLGDRLYPYGQASIDEAGRLDPYGMLFTERGVYRGGETMHVKGLFRQATVTGSATPAGKKVKLTANDSEGTAFFEKEVVLGAFGDVTADIAIPAGIRYGDLQVRAAVDGDSNGVSATTDALIAAYKPSEFKAVADADKPSFVRGDTASFTAHGDYLFGAPMAGAKATMTITRSPGSFHPPGLEELETSDGTYQEGHIEGAPDASVLKSDKVVLDGKGSASSSVPLTFAKMHGAEVVVLETTIEDFTRQTVSATATAIVHPAEVYVGLKRPDDDFVPAGKPKRFEAAVAGIDGSKRAGAAVAFTLYQRNFTSSAEELGEGEVHQSYKAVDKEIMSCRGTTDAKGIAGCDLTFPEHGYYVVRATSADKKGNPVAASLPVYVWGDEGGDVSWGASDSKNLDLVADKRQYKVGDTAKVLVKNPFREAEAWVTVERAGVMKSWRQTIKGPMARIEVPITEETRPNAYVSVMLVRGRTTPDPKSKTKGSPLDAPQFRLGYTNLEIDPESRRLAVQVTPTKKPDPAKGKTAEYGPGDEVDVDLAVLAAGKGVESSVTFYAVDEGVLMLTGYKTPDPIPAFSRHRPTALVPHESREDLGSIFTLKPPAGSDKGGDGGDGGGSVRGDFRATAFFAPTVLTGADGRAHVHFKLPDGLTTYRLMAVAASKDDRYGFGENQVITSRPLMARPALPRFLRAGDVFEAGVVVTAKGLPETQVTVKAEASGVKLDGDASRTVTVPANGSIEVRFPWTAGTVGKANFGFSVEGPNGLKDRVKLGRDVQVPTSIETVALEGETKDAGGERLGALEKARNDFGSLDVKLSSSALVGLDHGIEQLIEYPYGCTEQLTSRLLPLVALQDLTKAFGIALPPKADVEVDKAIGKIVARQRPSGGFSYWDDSPHVDPWVTGWALLGLDAAKKAGHAVPDNVLADAQRFLRSELSAGRGRHLEDLPEQVFFADVLATVGKPDAGYLTKLVERKKDLPLFSKALLLHALAVSKGSPDAQKALIADLDGATTVRVSGATVGDAGDRYARYLDSPARTTAMALRGVLASDPQNEMATKLAQGLLASRHGGTWRSTQETAWALLALDGFRKAREAVAPDYDARVFLGGSLLTEAPFHGASLAQKGASLSMAKLFDAEASGSTLAFQKLGGSGTLYYSARLRYATKELPKQPLERGFFVTRALRVVRPEDLLDAQRKLPSTVVKDVNAGDLVMVDLLVVSPDAREQVVIEDPLPAGFEAIQSELATSAPSANGAEGPADEGNEENYGDYGFESRPFHKEVHDDKVLVFVEHLNAGAYHFRYLARATGIGSFIVPPTRAECMYEPEIFGRTAATQIKVLAPKELPPTAALAPTKSR